MYKIYEDSKILHGCHLKNRIVTPNPNMKKMLALIYLHNQLNITAKFQNRVLLVLILLMVILVFLILRATLKFIPNSIDAGKSINLRNLSWVLHVSQPDQDVSMGPIRGPPCIASIKLVNLSLFLLFTSIFGCCNNNFTYKKQK